jgi:hypothetical protein
MWPRRWTANISYLCSTQERSDQAATYLGLQAEVVGTDIDAERLRLPRFENSSAIYDSDDHHEPN